MTARPTSARHIGGAPVVAIAAPPGAGKTTLARALVRDVPDARLIAYDNHQTVTRQSFDELAAWMERGGDTAEWALPELEQALSEARREARLVVFETPFGRLHPATGRFIDRLIWIDVPMDVALARQIRAFSKPILARDHAAALPYLRWLDTYLENYDRLIGRTYVLQRERVRPAADKIVDGTQSPKAILQQVMDDLLNCGYLGG